LVVITKEPIFFSQAPTVPIIVYYQHRRGFIAQIMMYGQPLMGTMENEYCLWAWHAYIERLTFQ